MKSQLITLLVGVLFLLSVQAQNHHNSTATFLDGCYFLNDDLVGCIKTEVQPCDGYWYFQLSAPVADNTFFVIGNGYVYFDMYFSQCYSSADGDKCFCLSFAGNTFDGENVLTTPGITANCNNMRVHNFDPITITGTSCGAAHFNFPCTQLFWAFEDDAPPTGGDGQVIFEKRGAKGSPNVVLPATNGGSGTGTGSGEPGDEPPIDGDGGVTPYNWYTSYVDVPPALVDDLLLFFAQHPEYPLGDYLHVQWECLYLSAPEEFADDYSIPFDAIERIEFYCPTIVMDTCNGNVALESKFGILLQSQLTVDGDNYVHTEISGVTIAASTEILEIGENYIGASVNVLFMDSLYEIDIHLAYTYPHCGYSSTDCPNPWGTYSYNVYGYTSLVTDFFSWVANSPPPSSDHHHHHHHHKSPSPVSSSPITFSFSSFSSFSSALNQSSGGDDNTNLAWLAILIVLPVLLVIVVVGILVFAFVVKKAGVLQQKRELNDGENVYSMMINQ